MRNILVTGGTVFVSRFVAEYFVKKGDRVYVLNRNNRTQSEGVLLIEGDRHALGDKLKDYDFDVVLDINGYTKEDVEDLCHFIEILLEKKPEDRTFNVGNLETVTIEEWVSLCYQTLGKVPKMRYVDESHKQRDYFCFYDYEYILDVSRQNILMSNTKPLQEGLKESLQWYREHSDQVRKKPYFEYIERNLTCLQCD